MQYTGCNYLMRAPNNSDPTCGLLETPRNYPAAWTPYAWPEFVSKALSGDSVENIGWGEHVPQGDGEQAKQNTDAAGSEKA